MILCYNTNVSVYLFFLGIVFKRRCIIMADMSVINYCIERLNKLPAITKDFICMTNDDFRFLVARVGVPFNEIVRIFKTEKFTVKRRLEDIGLKTALGGKIKGVTPDYSVTNEDVDEFINKLLDTRKRLNLKNDWDY